MKSGIKGCIGSPQLSIMVINTIIQEIMKSRIGYKISRKYTSILFFAGDGLVIVETVE